MGMDFTTIDRARLLLFTSGRRPNALMMSWRGRSHHQRRGNVSPALSTELRCQNIRSEWSSGETSNDRHWLEWLRAAGTGTMNWDGSVCLYTTAKWDWIRLLAFQGRSLPVGLLFPGHVNSFRFNNVGKREHGFLGGLASLLIEGRRPLNYCKVWVWTTTDV